MSMLLRFALTALACTSIAVAQSDNSDITEPRTGGEAPLPEQLSDDAMVARIKRNHLNWFLSTSFQVSNPQGQLQNALRAVEVPGSAYGFDLRVGYYMDPIPVAFTFEGGFQFLNADRRQRTVQSGLFRDTIDISTSTTIIPITASARFMPNLGTWVFPYIEGVIGVSTYSADYSVSQRRFEEIRSQSDDRTDAAFVYGIGLGASVKVADYVSLPNALQRLLVDVRMRYLYGTSVQVSNVELAINESDPMNSTYRFRSASVDMSDNIFFTLGIGFQF